LFGFIVRLNPNDLYESNGFAMGTSVKRSSAIDGSLARCTAGYDIEWAYRFEGSPITDASKRVPSRKSKSGGRTYDE
jgi:hypothetical protein